MREKRTKIIATISDRQCGIPLLKKLYAAGMDVVRINTAHQTPESSKEVIENVRKVSDKIAILIDVKGPELRTTEVDEPIHFKKGDEVTLGSGKEKTTKETIITNYPLSLPKGQTILFDDGEIEGVSDGKKIKIIHGGILKSNKGINIPDFSLDLPSLTKKDKTYLAFAKKENVDFVAQSFVRRKQDVLDAKKYLKGTDIGIIAKIENGEGVENIKEILEEVYGVMIARGDLGMELPPEDVPLIQKELINASIAASKPPIVATQMLQSMIENPRATRAEVSDVANAILDGASAVMLSGETAYGKFPEKAVGLMSKIAKKVESKKEKYKYAATKQDMKDVREHLARSAVMMAADLNIKAIIVPSASGKTARFVAAFRGNTPIYAPCYNETVMRQLMLSYGVLPGHLKKMKTTDQLTKFSVQQYLEIHSLKQDDLVMILGSTPESVKEGTNFIEINTVRHCLEN